MKRMWSKNELLALSNAQIRSLIESGEIDNAKPIYCHPVHLENQQVGENNYHLTFLIFTNDATPFTLETFEDWIQDLKASLGENNEVQLLCSGGITDGATILIASYLFLNDSDTWGIAGLSIAGSTTAIYAQSFEGVFDEHAVLKDAVNKIN